MPNYCDFEAKVKGKKKNVFKFFEWLSAQYDYSSTPDVYYIIGDQETGIKMPTEHHIGYRVFETYFTPEDYKNEMPDEEIIGFGYGYCAWSVSSCMMDGPHTYLDDGSKSLDRKAISLSDACEKLNCSCEIFSTEPGCAFSEHILIDDTGYIEIDGCSDYQEFYMEGCSTLRELKDYYKKEYNSELPSVVTEELFNKFYMNGFEYIRICDNYDEDGEFIWTL